MLNEQLIKDCETLDIQDIEKLTVRCLTLKYKKLAKQRHPDREGGNTVDFQDLQNAYKRIIKHLEGDDEGVVGEDDIEKEFFTKHNVCKTCTSSYVIYIQNKDVKSWKVVLEKHMAVHKSDKKRAIYKTGKFTITLYDMTKIDPRSKIHVQSGDQQANLEFIMETLSAMYQEVVKLQERPTSALQMIRMSSSVRKKPCYRSPSHKY